MSNPAIDLTEGIKVTSQLPLNAKTYFKTIADMQYLGTNDSNAYLYYEGMIVFCLENKKLYVWRKQSNYEIGVLEEGMTYPNGVLANGIDYSNETYNWFPYYEENINTVNNVGYRGGMVYYLGNNYDYIISSVLLFKNGIVIPIFQNPVTLSAADATNDRYDLFVLNIINDTTEVIEGTPAADPLKPYYNPNHYILLGTVRVTANTTEPIVENTIVYDENAQVAGGEFNTSTDNASAVDLGSGLDPQLNSGHIIVKQGNGTSGITFDSNSVINANDINSLAFYIKLTGINRATPFDIFLRDSNDNVVGDILQPFIISPIDLSESNDYQIMVIDFALFNANEFSKITFKIGDALEDIKLDNIQLVRSLINPILSDSWLSLSDTFDTDYENKNGYYPQVKNNKLYLTKPNFVVINGTPVRKQQGNNNLETLETGDIVNDKILTIDGTDFRLPYGVYNGGNQNDVSGYDIPPVLN